MAYTALRIAPDTPGIQEQGHALIYMLTDLYSVEHAAAIMVQALTSLCVGLIKCGASTADLNRVQILELLDELRAHVITETDAAVKTATKISAQDRRC